MKLSSLCFCSLFFSQIVNSAAADRMISVEHGLWEYTHTLEIPGVLAPMTTPKSECVSPDEARRSLSEMLGQLSDGPGCVVSDLKDDLSSVSFILTCTPELDGVSLEARGQLTFRYGRTSIKGSATGLVSLAGVEMPINATGNARRVGRCPN